MVLEYGVSDRVWFSRMDLLKVLGVSSSGFPHTQIIWEKWLLAGK